MNISESKRKWLSLIEWSLVIAVAGWIIFISETWYCALFGARFFGAQTAAIIHRICWVVTLIMRTGGGVFAFIVTIGLWSVRLPSEEHNRFAVDKIITLLLFSVTVFFWIAIITSPLWSTD